MEEAFSLRDRLKEERQLSYSGLTWQVAFFWGQYRGTEEPELRVYRTYPPLC